MSSLERKLYPIGTSINAKIILPENLGYKETISLNYNQTLNDQFKSFLLEKNTKLKKGYYFYLKKDKDIIQSLPKNKTVKDLNLQPNDIILVSYEKKQINSQLIISSSNIQHSKECISDIENLAEKLSKKKSIINTPREKSQGTNGYQKDMKKKRLIIIIIFIIFIFFIFAGLVFLIIYLIKNKKKIDEKNKPPIFNKDKLIVEKKYPINMLLRYSNKKETEMKLEGEKIPKEKDSSQSLWTTSDFIFIIRDEKVEKDEIKLTEKNLYTGYIAFLNLTSYNKTNKTMIVYDKTLNKILNNNNNNNNLTSLKEPDLKYIGKKGNFRLAKIEFYLNGDIKNYYLSQGMSRTEFSFIEEISKLIIPKISSNLYIKSINEYLNDLAENGTENNITEFEKKRILNVLNSNKKQIFKKRILNNESENKSNYDIDDDDEEVEIEEYKTTPLNPSFNYDLREANKMNESSDEINNETKEGNYSNLTHYSLKNAECEDAKMEGSTVNSTTYSIINDKGLLESVEQNIVSVMETQNMGNGNDRETDLLYSSVYDNNNQISFIDSEEINNDTNQNQNIDFGISSLVTTNSQTINLSDYFINEDINKKIYSYFDNFVYEKYNESSELENKEEGEEDDNEYENRKEGNNKRNLNSNQENTYYGMKKLPKLNSYINIT